MNINKVNDNKRKRSNVPVLFRMSRGRIKNRFSGYPKIAKKST